MKTGTIRWVITGAAMVVALIHLIWPSFSLDTTYIVLIVVAVIPWLAPIIKSVELPGGIKIEVQDVEQAANKVTKARLEAGKTKMMGNIQVPQPVSCPVDPLATVKNLALSDPNLAMVGFRIEVERRLSIIAERHGISAEKKSVSQLLRSLRDINVFPDSVIDGLAELVAIGNQAAHGASVSQTVADTMLAEGSRVLAVLDTEIERNN
jgi:hypothetical protein